MTGNIVSTQADALRAFFARVRPYYRELFNMAHAICGNYELAEKAKLDNYEYEGDLYKIKTFREMTKLERNGLFVYESVPGTTVENFTETEAGVEFIVESWEDAQITLGLEADTEYEVFVAGESAGKMSTNLGGKLSVGVELSSTSRVDVKVVRV